MQTIFPIRLQGVVDKVAKGKRLCGDAVNAAAKRAAGVTACIVVATVMAGSPLIASDPILFAPNLSELPSLQGPPATVAEPASGMFLREFRLQGSTLLSAKEVEKAVYPYLGPGRSAEDVEKARAALQKLYHDKGYQTVSVQIPQQKVRRGVVVLQANEVAVGKLRVRGAQYHEPAQIINSVPSLAEGKVPNFKEVMDEVVALNRTADRQVVPELVPGSEPGTVDVELQVKDSLPLHGSLELNNRNSLNTTALRLNGSLRYDNLWQKGHSIGGSFQISPQDISEVKVFSGYYLARFDGLEDFTLTLSGTNQDSNVSTLGNVASMDKGYTIGLRGAYTLPMWDMYFHSISLGVDYKESDQETQISGSTATTSPINYIPVSLGYSGGWRGKDQSVNLYLGLTTHFRGAGSSGWEEWNRKRGGLKDNNKNMGADGSFIILRGDLSYTVELSEHLESYVRLHGQLADSPLISAEQSAGGGLDTVRGYYEAEIAADQSLFGTFELRLGNLPVVFRDPADNDSIRLFAFADGGLLNNRQPLPEENKNSYLASFGAGARFSFLKHFSGSVTLGVPLIDAKDKETKAWHPRAIFTIRGEF